MHDPLTTHMHMIDAYYRACGFLLSWRLAVYSLIQIATIAPNRGPYPFEGSFLRNELPFQNVCSRHTVDTTIRAQLARNQSGLAAHLALGDPFC